MWLHLHCIGLKPEQVPEDEDFICRDCKPNRDKNQRVRHFINLLFTAKYKIKLNPICFVKLFKILFILEKENNGRINTIDLHIILNDYHEHGQCAISVTQERTIMIS